MYGYIYLTTNKINGKKYIGQHTKETFDKSYYGSGIHITRAIKKYGKDNFTCEVLDWAETKEELDELEIEWIAKSDAIHSDEYYNIAPGGGGVGSGEFNPNYGKPSPMRGRKHTEESRKKMSEAHIGVQAGEKCYWWGKQRSDDTKRKMSINRRGKTAGENHPMWGKHHSEETKHKLSEAKKEWCSNEENKKILSEAMKGKLAGEKNPSCRPIVQLALSGELIREYQYISQAKQFGFPQNGKIGECCRGRRELYKGFKWMYKEDYDELSRHCSIE